MENPAQSSAEAAARPTAVDVGGAKLFSGWLTSVEQRAMVEDIRTVAAVAPFFAPVTPWGKPMSVRMTAAGRFGWITYPKGYRYSAAHPDGHAWPAIPASVLSIWRELVSPERDPDCCLVNFYGESARMGLHQDRDEKDFSWPVLSISLGDDALFRIGGVRRGDKTQSVWLRSGDVLILGGEARLAYHGIDRIEAGISTLLPKGGRINLTLRVVT